MLFSIYRYMKTFYANNFENYSSNFHAGFFKNYLVLWKDDFRPNYDSFFYCWYIYSLRVFATINTLRHLSLSWIASLQSSTPRVFRSSSSIMSIHISYVFFPWKALGLFLCGFHSSALLFFPLLIIWSNHCIL